MRPSSPTLGDDVLGVVHNVDMDGDEPQRGAFTGRNTGPAAKVL